MQSPYDEDYFLRGKESGKSLYENYRWLPELTIPMAKKMVEHCGIRKKDKILDFGCARGYLVKAFLRSGYFDSYGVDLSEWAIRNCDEDVGHCVATAWPVKDPDWIIAKDVLEHLCWTEVKETVSLFGNRAKKGFLIVVPLATNNVSYDVLEYEQDVTHVIRWPLGGWAATCLAELDEKWDMSVSYRIKGIKDNYAHYPKGNGFITCRRIQ